ncbi:hypothetical protein SAMN00017405_1112 [Desulfonispora thiosulfatigenes DSM 11270]|uniref:Uncharacterized protein n=1 Tax=Desulfonispora thiosulfatigenes DSM 11270 TaxID=656914 RepID=A0A1W1UY92_DESTI|nr:hypothetical protein [Desulfonispora thiosulfatigenes]SMB86077.1 hypothetical protein SAMN00017405_1112 [Desulfonispora thiosulfatigenes DSM 11270]
MEKPKHPSEDLNELEEWTENQYNPGHYIGGKVPHHMKKINKIYFIFLLGILSLLGGIVIGGYLYKTFENEIISGLATILTIVTCMRGYTCYKHRNE